jgi:hypothetical protein
MQARPRILDALRLARRAFLFFLLNTVLGIVALCAVGWGRPMETWETDSVLLGNRLDASYDYVLAGTSRTYFMSRARANHEALESALSGRVLNIGLPTAGGIKPAYTYLDYVLRQGVQPETLLLCLDPFVLYGEGWNENHKFVYFEPFRPGFLAQIIRDRYPWRRIFVYIRSKFSMDWLQSGPEPLDRFKAEVPTMPAPEHVQKRMANIYQEGVKPELFARYSPWLEAILTRCESAGIAVHIITLPTLLGPEPGQEATEQFLHSLKERHDFTYHNWVDALQRPEYFFDLDHLNTRGVEAVAARMRELLDSPAQKTTAE